MPEQRETLPPPALPSGDQTQSVALFLDFDGTLVEIADQPDAIDVATMLPDALRDLKERMSGRLAIVSGRSIEDLRQYLGASFDVAMAGSHGAARQLANGDPLGDQPKALPGSVVEKLREFAKDNGLRYETKTHGGALHYRENPDAEKAAHQFAETVARENGLTVKTGKCVVELVHNGADKGSAVRAFMQIAPFKGAVPVFVGDDVTDEDGFAAVAKLGGYGVLVGEQRETAARYRLASVAQVHQWLGL